ncbi:MAG: glycosyltransferase [Ruminococcaceae bacterium]|nr:glycosyltransferase [Oscillospiraceae bacterium]
MTILIPAYEPNEKLIALIKDLKNEDLEEKNCRILVVNDGSGEKYEHIFDKVREENIEVLVHEVNKGKGEAMKTGFAHIKDSSDYTAPVVTADCDGQHRPKDIMAVAKASGENPSHLILGCRHFVAKDGEEYVVPLRNRLGNLFTVSLFRVATGMRVSDTQTGLRGFSEDMLPWLLSVGGSRFEYEQKMLLETKAAGFPVFEIPIDTVYDKENYSSHYRPVADSIRVVKPILKYFTASFASFIIDYILVLVFDMYFSLFTSVVAARVISASANFTMNKFLVFNDTKKKTGASLIKYAVLAVAMVFASYGLLYLFRDMLSIPLALAKPIADVILFCASYWIQRRYIFF